MQRERANEDAFVEPMPPTRSQAATSLLRTVISTYLPSLSSFAIMSSPPSALTHPHTSHYLLSALRPRPPPSPAPPQHVTSPLSRTLALNPDDASASSSASLLSSSPRPTFARRASTTPAGASAGSAGLREGLLAQVVGCLEEEDEGEEKLKVLLGEELSWEHKVRADVIVHHAKQG
jgi:hypothetical protein